MTEQAKHPTILLDETGAPVAPIPQRDVPPRIRDISELRGIAHDPLAYGPLGASAP